MGPRETPAHPVVTIDPRGVALVLGLVAAALTLLSWAVLASRYFLDRGRLFGAVGLFDVDVENSVSTFFQAALLVCCAALLFLTAREERRRRGSHVTVWLADAGVFAYLAVDEASTIHELLIVPIDRALDVGGFLSFGWVIPFGVLVLAFVAINLRLLRTLDGSTRRRFLIAGALYVAGAIGMEMIGGRWSDVHGFDNAVYRMLMTTPEETLEAAGLVLFVFALLDRLGRIGARAEIRVRAPSSAR